MKERVNVGKCIFGFSLMIVVSRAFWLSPPARSSGPPHRLSFPRPCSSKKARSFCRARCCKKRALA